MRHILRYLNGMKNCGLEYHRTGRRTETYSAADWRATEVYQKSYSQQHSVDPSLKQHFIAVSTLESDFFALNKTARDFMFLKHLKKYARRNEYMNKCEINIDNQGSTKLTDQNILI